MRTYNQWLNYQQLEQIPLHSKRKLLALQQLSHYFVRFGSPRNEPRVRQIKDRRGNVTFHVYDPVSRKSTQLSSEKEARIWLEQRYYN